MQVTADPAGTRDDTTTPVAVQETRPVRLLVPRERRDEYYLSHYDTLRASDLGITRHTTDAEIDEILNGPGAVGNRKGLLRLRDGLRHPRDVQEAVAWGYRVPNWLDPLDLANADELGITGKTSDAELKTMLDDARELLDEDGNPTGETPEQYLRRLRDARRDARGENEQEIDPDPKKRLGWWWVYDPELVETRQQREERMLADERLVDMRGFAAAIVRQFTTVKDIKHSGDTATKVVKNPVHRRRLARTYVENKAARTVAEAEAKLLKEAQQDILKALPAPHMRAGNSNLWTLATAFADGYARTRLNEWYEFNKILQTGRPKGSRTVNRRPKAAQS